MTDAIRNEVARIVGETAGFVSMCWNPEPCQQVFQSTEAGEAVNAAIDKLFEKFNITSKES